MRKTLRQGSFKREAAFQRSLALATLLLATAGCTAPEQQGGQTNVAGVAHICSSCHGIQGRSVSPTFPNLAGQQRDYLAAQLKAFRDRTRADPHAHTYMWGMAAHLSDPTIDALAAYYAAQTPAAGRPGDPVQIAAGKAIFEQGIPAGNVPACGTCHGDQAQGADNFPRLAGQHRDYLAEQLEAFQTMSRANETMHENAKNLTGRQIADLAAYLAAQ